MICTFPHQQWSFWVFKQHCRNSSSSLWLSVSAAQHDRAETQVTVCWLFFFRFITFSKCYKSCFYFLKFSDPTVKHFFESNTERKGELWMDPGRTLDKCHSDVSAETGRSVIQSNFTAMKTNFAPRRASLELYWRFIRLKKVQLCKGLTEIVIVFVARQSVAWFCTQLTSEHLVWVSILTFIFCKHCPWMT